LADICGYELPTNLKNFMQKDLTKVKIFQKVLLGGWRVVLKLPWVYTTSGKYWRAGEWSLSYHEFTLHLASIGGLASGP